MRTLAELRPGERAVVERVDASEPDVHRLMVLGLVEGTEVSLRGTAFGGDPIELDVLGSSVSLRRDLARRFTLRETSAGE
jgi:ferrous iron transport protein A